MNAAHRGRPLQGGLRGQDRKKTDLHDGCVNIFITVAAEYLDDNNFESDEVKALTRSLLTQMKRISENNSLNVRCTDKASNVH